MILLVVLLGKNRDRLSIVAAILEAVNSGASKTRIMFSANLSFSLLEKYLANYFGSRICSCRKLQIFVN
jgi:predicted transcriptional regulator